MNQFYQNQKLLKLKYLLQNSKIKTIPTNPEIVNSGLNSDFSVTNCFSEKHYNEMDISKDLSLFLNLIEKPLNLLFSIDQFVFEFSKKTYQQKKTGEFFQQLKERKKLSLFYGNLTRKQISNLFNKVKRTKGYCSKNVFSLLEKRLDVVLYRSGFTKTITEARQLIKHEKILVNKKVVNVPSFLLTPGDFISVTSKTGESLNNKLANFLKTEFIKNTPKMSEDFYSKLRKTVDSVPHFLSQNQSFGKSKSSFDNKREFNNSKKVLSSNLGVLEKFRSKQICRLLMQLLCTKIKSRCFYSLKKSKFYLNKISLEISNSSKNSLTILKKSILTMLKWKSILKKKQFFSKKSVENSHTKVIKHKKTIYATHGCLQEKPVFWNRKVLILKQKKFLNKTDKKQFKFVPLKKTNLELYRKSFIMVLKHLENYNKFTSLVTLNINKFLLKKSFFKEKRNDKQINLLKFSKNLNFRLTRPLNVEISYNLLNIVYLYSPQRINFPFSIDLDLIQRSLH